MAPKKHINWQPFIQKVLEKWALESTPKLPEPRHCTLGHTSRLRESGPHAVAYFYLVTAAEPGPWYVIDSVLWDTEKKSKLREATFIVPCRDPPSARHPFVCEWDDALKVYVVRHLKEAENIKSTKQQSTKNKVTKKNPKRSPKKGSKTEVENKDSSGPMNSYDGASDKPAGNSDHNANGQQHSVGDVFSTRSLAPLNEASLDNRNLSDSGEAVALDGKESSSCSLEPGACSEYTPEPNQPIENTINESSEEPNDTDSNNIDAPTSKFSESFQEEVVEGYNAADYECYRQDTELSGDALDEIYRRDQAQDGHLPIHHYNFFGNAMTGRSSTPPEVSLLVLLLGPKGWSHEGCCRASLMYRAIKHIDPVLYTGPLEVLSYARTSDLLKGIAGYVHKFYTGHGTWVQEKGKAGQRRPILDPTNSDMYYSEPWLPFNGLLNPHWRAWSRKDFKGGMCEIGPVRNRVRVRPIPKSPLSQCVLASEL
ncbi:hypothetical protein MGYG_03242 [Nannizzia gypsea CBS 118893]|uniref:Uncharacterized protein n=1 Tax=Arthroderma gypseum (strain ATCC MYA-4604 / CBS 118893) TaxID=535722 RepID=E4URM9_ARTGP|nr:hypothetical protein MGYG_03242 [Nannizzia gypsea CBS 118893]EFR00239.1 hypothetical protein MGYG_03242 [Nannizzia gypsea CBS 118893]